MQRYNCLILSDDSSTIEKTLGSHGLSASIRGHQERGDINAFNQMILIFPLLDQVALVDEVAILQEANPHASLIVFTPKANQRALRKNKAVTVVPISNWDPIWVTDIVTAWMIWKNFEETSSFGSLYGATPVMRSIYEEIRVIAAVKHPVFLFGPRGTGKELAARQLHDLGRSGKPFLAVNCAGLSKELAASTLFGNEKGAFTGADRTREGIFSKAKEGTVFLDEVGELNLDIQSQLLRTLQENTILKVGGVYEEPIQARIILGSNKDLDEEVRKGNFRQDFFDRITFRINLPQLAERKTDIPLLAELFLRQFNEEYNKQLRLPSDLLETLMEYPWPGNVRELKQAIEKAAAFTDGETGNLDPTRMLDHMQQRRSLLPAEPGGQIFDYTKTWKYHHDRLLCQYLKGLLLATGGDKKKAVALSGMSRATFYEKLKLMDKT